MNYEEAVEQHMGWPYHLGLYAEKRDGSIKAADVEAVDTCSLGRWMKAEERVYGALPEYVALKQAHEKVHLAASEVVRQVDAGALTKKALEGKSPLTMALVEFVTALTQMTRKLP